MASLMKVSGCKENDKDLVSKYGLMAPNMLDNGNIIKPMDKGLYIMLMEIFIKVNGLMIRLVDREHIHIKMVPNMLVSGKTINKMVMVSNSGLMDKSMKDNIRMALKLVKEF